MARKVKRVNRESVFLALVGREIRCLVRDSKFIYLSVLLAVFAPVFLRIHSRTIQPCFLVPLLPAVALSVWGPNQFGLDGPGFARFALSPQPMRTVLLSKQVVWAGAFLLHTGIGVTVLLTRGTCVAAEIVSTIGIAFMALFCFLSAGLALSCVRPWPSQLAFGGNIGVVDAWIGQTVVFLAAALPSFCLWCARARLNELDLLSRVELLTAMTGLSACLWWLTVRVAAGFVERNAMAIQTRLMP